MLAIFICASAASDMLGKKVMKSLYSLSAWVMAAAPPSAYHESPMASLARATYSESGYVLIRVCRLSRATSYLLCFIASMARSNSTLSGCLELMLAMGFWTFLLLHPRVSSMAAIENAMMTRRNILNTSGKYCLPRLGAQQSGFLGRLQQRLHLTGRIAVAKHVAAGNENFHSSPNGWSDRCQVHAAIDFNAIVQTLGGAHGCQLADFLQRPGNELLPAKTGIHRHHQDVVHQIEHLAERLHRGGRVEDHADLHTVAANQFQGAVQVAAHFLMHRDPVGPGVGESRNVVVGILNHQMTVQRNIHGFTQRRDHRRPNRDIGHKVAIHDIHMEQGGATSHRLVGILGQAGEISRQYGRRYLDQDKTSLRRIWSNFSTGAGPVLTAMNRAEPMSRPAKYHASVPATYSAACSAALLVAMVSATSPTLKRANRRTERFSPSLPTTVAISWCTVMVWSLIKGCSYRQTSS